MIKTYLNFKKTLALVSMALPAFMQVNAQTVLTYSYTGSMQQFTVPALCVPSITIQAKGAQGGFNTSSVIGSGLGADMTGVFAVSAGQVFNILVGQQPSNTASNGGGGGTYVTDLSNSPLIIAGGGGGSAGTVDSPNKHGQAGTAGAQGSAGGTGIGGVGGTAGNGGNTGTSSYNGGAGGGLLTNGVAGGPGAASGGSAFVNGGTGGLGAGPGGYGGGGAGSSNFVGGGGGGYSGGGAGANDGGVGGGGSSFNSGTGQVNVGGINTGHGVVIISYFAQIPIPVSASSSVICNGSSTSLTASGMTTYTWLPVGSFAGSNSAAITVTPNTTTSYSVTGTSAAGCPGNGVITITVSSALPTLTVTSSTPTICLGNTVALTATGALTHIWTGGITNGVAFAPSATTGYTVTGTNGCGSSSAAITVTVSALPILVSASSTTICASTAVTLMGGGATTYTWMPGNSTQTNYITNPAANTVYTVTGKTGNCLGVNTITITTKPNPTITIAPSTATICEGGSAMLTANGGLTYTWNPVVSSNTAITVSPTLSTLYTVVGTNAVNCNASASQVILVSAKPVMTVTASNPLVCPGGASTLTATGANTYLWGSVTPGSTLVVNPTSTTTYTVEGTGLNTCSSATMITVTVFDPTLSLSSSTAVCRGTNVNINASGMDTYQWSTGSGFSSISVTPTITTTYSVNSSSTQGAVTCSVSGAVTVSVNPNPTITAISNPTTICKGESAVITASGAVTYTWAGSTPTESAVITVTPSADQSYTVAGVDANGCKGTGSIFLRVAGCVGISANLSDAADLSVYPNPSNGDFTISSEKSIDLNITNELGQQVKTISLTHDTKEVKVSGLSSGIYFISGKNENGTVKQKIIITK